MDLTPTDDQQAFRQSLRRFVEATCTPAERRRHLHSDKGFDAEVWRRMADELGLQGLVVPVECGGAGSGWTEMAIVMEELGRRLAGGPMLSTAAVVPALLSGLAGDRPNDLLEAVAAGRLVVAAAIPDRSGQLPTLAAQRNGSGGTLDGRADFVLDAPVADVLVAAARTADGIALFAVQASDVRLEPLVTLDLTRRQSTVMFTSTPGALLAECSSAHLDRAVQLATVATAADQLGGAATCLEMAVEHARTRRQFGRAIGSFQAVKHMCAEMLVDVEAARSAVLYAAWVADHDQTQLAEASSLAKVVASDAFCRVAARAIQVHGGIGFTWEHDLHLYYRRAYSTNVLFGSPAQHRAMLAAVMRFAS